MFVNYLTEATGAIITNGCHQTCAVIIINVLVCTTKQCTLPMDTNITAHEAGKIRDQSLIKWRGGKFNPMLTATKKNEEYSLIPNLPAAVVELYGLTATARCTQAHFTHHVSSQTEEKLERSAGIALTHYCDGGRAKGIYGGNHGFVAGVKMSGYTNDTKQLECVIYSMLSNVSEDIESTELIMRSQRDANISPNYHMGDQQSTILDIDTHWNIN
eukprot:328260_1